MCISNTSSCSATGWESYTGSKSRTLEATDGEKEVAVRFRDSATNESNRYADSILLDTTLPTASLTYTPEQNTRTNGSVKVTLTTDETIATISEGRTAS
jgi:hypothetical protein